jgi:hypothetical protein
MTVVKQRTEDAGSERYTRTSQLQVNNEDPLTRLGQREQDVPFAYISNHRDYRSAAGITNLATDHQVGS